MFAVRREGCAVDVGSVLTALVRAARTAHDERVQGIDFPQGVKGVEGQRTAAVIGNGQVHSVRRHVAGVFAVLRQSGEFFVDKFKTVSAPVPGIDGGGLVGHFAHGIDVRSVYGQERGIWHLRLGYLFSAFVIIGVEAVRVGSDKQGFRLLSAGCRHQCADCHNDLSHTANITIILRMWLAKTKIAIFGPGQFDLNCAPKVGHKKLLG